MTTSRYRRFVASSALIAGLTAPVTARAQAVTARGFVEGVGQAFAEDVAGDSTQAVGDARARTEAFVKPAAWLRLAGGIEFRANTHDQVDDRWRIDWDDRGALAPRLSVYRAVATVTRGPLTVDAGKQFIRWGKTDIVTPTDRFAPRDFTNVLDTEFIAVTGLHVTAARAGDALEAVWVPRFTPSRSPVFGQRWAPVPVVPGLRVVDGGGVFPGGAETGVRWSHMGGAYEFAASFFDGSNHLPTIDVLPTSPVEVAVRRVYAPMRSYGLDAAVPTRWMTIKGEAAYFTSNDARADEYVLYVVQVERQSGEWLFVGGYAGEAVTARRSAQTFAPDRGLSRAVVARASYTIDARRSVAAETAVRQNAAGIYGKAEYSEARGAHWRATVTGVVLAGKADDFLGQYERNSHVALRLRYSF